MWRFLTFLHMWHVCDVKMSTYMQNLCHFVSFLQFTYLCREICLVVIYALLCGEFFLENCISGEKMTNMRSVSKGISWTIFKVYFHHLKFDQGERPDLRECSDSLPHRCLCRHPCLLPRMLWRIQGDQVDAHCGRFSSAC